MTRQIPRSEWTNHFDRFTRRHLGERRDVPVTLEVVSQTLGAEVEAQRVRLLGLTYDSRSEAFEVLLEEVDHLAFQPTEIWVVEEDDGFLSALQIARSDGTKEILHLHRSGATRSAPPHE